MSDHRKKSQLVGSRLGGLLPDFVVGPACGSTSTGRSTTARRMRLFGAGALSSEERMRGPPGTRRFSQHFSRECQKHGW
jgi:hypothetical protein